MPEHLIRVKSFDELRDGWIIVVKPLIGCEHASHRGLLIKASADGSIRIRSTGQLLPPGTPRFHMVPVPSCNDHPSGNESITSLPVERGAVYRVLDGLESSPGTAAGADRTTHTRKTTDVR